jgi:hypothetical protein
VKGDSKFLQNVAGLCQHGHAALQRRKPTSTQIS